MDLLLTEIKSIEDEIDRVYAQTQLMFLPIQNITSKKYEIEVEYSVTYDLSENFVKISYLINKTIYFITSYLIKLKNIIQYSQGVIKDSKSDIICIGIPQNLQYEIGYEFDAFITSFYTLIDAENKDEVLNQILTIVSHGKEKGVKIQDYYNISNFS